MSKLPDSLQQRLQSCRTLPSIPVVVLEVLNLCEREDINIGEITRVLSRDPALAAKVLRMANSAFYGTRSQITTVDRAISIMGINATLSLALGFSLASNLNKSHKAGFDYVTYWRRSTVAAASSQALAKWTNDMKPRELFFAGLLQDIGMLALNEVFPGIYGKLVAASNQQHNRLVELENNAYGTDHGAIGSWLLESWEFPKNLRISVAASHNPQLQQESRDAGYIAVLSLAGHIAEIWCSPDTAAATLGARQYASELLEMSDDKFGQVLVGIAASLPDITQNLDVDIGGEERVKGLLDQAREALVMLNIQVQRQVYDMKNLAETDGLTSLYNRGYLENVLPQLLNQAEMTGQHLSMIFVDIDHFKNINDNHGHQAGDRILVAVSGIISGTLRKTDITVRYGGDEFVCLLPNTPEEAAKLVAERLRTAIAAFRHELDNKEQIHVTASFGCAAHSPKCLFKSPEQFLKEADRCLYIAKQAGRNRVMSSPSGEANRT
jgi:diguanylate cyclase (GGDEF)-like protein